MNKKTIVVTIISALAVVILLFISFKAFGFIKLKNDCIQKNTKQEGHSVSMSLDANSSQEKINNYINKIKVISGVKDVSLKTSEDALNEFKKENEGDKQIMDQINSLPKNPLSSSIIINSEITDISEFLNLETKLKNEADTEGLVIRRMEDGRLKYNQEELKKVEGASLGKDLFRFIFSGDGDNFFAKNYSQICFPRSF